MHELRAILEKSTRLAIGLMSGTSADGVDAVLVRINGCGKETKVESLAFLTRPYDQAIRERVLAAGEATASEVALLNFELGEIFAAAALKAIEFGGTKPQIVDFIASHGQTIYHDPDREDGKRSTLQIGEGSVIAERTGIPVICDFRPRDIAAGGTGAPLVPYVDCLLFRHAEKSRVLLNLGGIASLTILPAGSSMSDVLAFDVGPCNMLLDALAEILLDKPRDEGGELAASGRPCKPLLDEFMAHPYFGAKPPKSTGRELFGDRYASKFLAAARRNGLNERDTLASAGEFVIESVSQALETLVPPSYREVNEVIVSGGGTNNRMLMDGLAKAFRSSLVVTSREYGINPDAKEAIAFAILGNETLEGRPANLPMATGATKQAVLGKICPAGPRG